MEQSTKQNNRFSYVRVIACIGIIVLHMTYGAVSMYGNQVGTFARNISWSVVNNLYWAVPCFVMVSGALLLDPKREMTYKKIFSKYVFRVVIALLVFTILYRIFDIVMNKEVFTVSGILKAFANFFTDGSWSHLWYLYMLIGLYLLLMFYRKIVANSTVKELAYLLLVYFVFISVLSLLKIWNIEVGFYIHTATIYPFYFIFGYFITVLDKKYAAKLALLILIVATALITVLTIVRWNNGDARIDMLFSYSSVLVVLQAISIFTLFAKGLQKSVIGTEVSERKHSAFGKLVLSFDKCSFGIYLVHMFFARIVLRYMGFNPYSNVLLFIGFIILIAVISYLVVFALRKIPGVKKVL